MRRELILHPDFRCPPVTGLTGEATRSGDILTLVFRISGALGDLRIPPPAPPHRTEELWRHTCLEGFVRGPGEAYYEFNFSPSSQWAAYRFDGYRAGMAAAEGVAPIDIEVSLDDAALELTVDLDLSPLPELAGQPWRLGLSAVIEDARGQVAYWALAHPAGRPDFHHADGLVAELPLTDRP